MLTIKFMGTGSAFSKKYGHTNMLLSQGQTQLMIDFGFRAPEGLARQNVSMKDISHVFISHLHADHVGGLEELGFISYFLYHQKPTLILPGNLSHTLWENSLKGGMEWISDEQGKAQQCTLESYFNVQRIGLDWTSIDGIDIKPFVVDHVPGKEAYGFHVREAATGAKVIFTCDCRTQLPELLSEPIHPDFTDGIIFHDCQLFKEGHSRVHTLLSDLLAYPKPIRERIFITHYGDNIQHYLQTVYQHGLRVAWPDQSMPIDLSQ